MSARSQIITKLETGITNFTIRSQRIESSIKQLTTELDTVQKKLDDWTRELEHYKEFGEKHESKD